METIWHNPIPNGLWLFTLTNNSCDAHVMISGRHFRYVVSPKQQYEFQSLVPPHSCTPTRVVILWLSSSSLSQQLVPSFQWLLSDRSQSGRKSGTIHQPMFGSTRQGQNFRALQVPSLSKPLSLGMRGPRNLGSAKGVWFTTQGSQRVSIYAIRHGLPSLLTEDTCIHVPENRTYKR